MDTVAEEVSQPLGKLVLPWVEERLSYVFSNKKHVEDLGKELKMLENKRLGIDERVNEAERQGDTVSPNVDEWKKQADEIIGESQNFLGRSTYAACFFNISYLYKSGKQAANLYKKVTDMYKEATGFDVVAIPRPPAPITVSYAAKGGEELRSREAILAKVICALLDETVGVVGLHGMGGVGKTTLVDKLIVQARDEKLFDVVAKAVVSRTPNIREIQRQIADRIQFKFHADSTAGRIDELCEILSKKTQNNRKILLILDDVWEEIDITAQIGIPRMKCCKVLITSRNIQVMRAEPINADKLIEVGVLEKEEAKILFVEKLGDYYHSAVEKDSQYTTIMEDLLKGCGGLPLALVTLAGALKGKDYYLWKVANERLSKHCGGKIDGMDEKVWKTLKFSFDSLQNEGAKKVLLLCSLFPEDANIPVQKLVSYGFGINLFEDSCRLADAMTQVHGFVDQLVSCSLLLSAKLAKSTYRRSGSYCVQVHDVIRDVAMDIASKEYNFFTGTSFPKKEDLVAISLSIEETENIEGQLLDVSSLKILRLQCNRNVCIPIDFFKGMEKLKVLDLIIFVKGLVFSIHDHLINLEHLFLEIRTDGFGVCMLMKYELAGRRMELPINFEGLKYLKVLDLSNCSKDIKIPTNFIAGLLRLEGLLLAYEQMINFAELQWCRRLQILHAGLKVTAVPQMPQEVASILKNLSSFKLLITSQPVSISSRFISFCRSYLVDKLFPKMLMLSDVESLVVHSIMDIIPKGLHSLRCFRIEGLTDLKMVESSMLKELVVEDCNRMSYVFASDAGLSKLEEVSLSNLPQLEGICEPKGLPKIMFSGTSTTLRAAKTSLFSPQELLQAASFSQLRVLEISKLPRLTSVFPSLTLYKQTLTTLQEMELRDCESLEEVIAAAEEGDRMDLASKMNPITLSLGKINLHSLPRLLHFYGGKHTLKFPLLQDIKVGACEHFKSLADLSEEGLAYSRLERVQVSFCDDMKYMFPADAVLSNLKFLQLNTMGQLEDICENDGGALWKSSFPALQIMKLDGLPKIKNYNTTSHEAARKYLFGPEDVLPAIEFVDLFGMDYAGIWHFPLTNAGSFSHLRELSIGRMPHIKYLFPSLSFCTDLVNRLEMLRIVECENLEVVIFGEDEDKDVANHHNIISLLPALKMIYLWRLPKLKHFYGGRHTLKLPLLHEVSIWGCESMESFATISPDAPSLTDVNSLQNQPSRYLDLKGKFWACLNDTRQIEPDVETSTQLGQNIKS